MTSRSWTGLPSAYDRVVDVGIRSQILLPPVPVAKLALRGDLREPLSCFAREAEMRLGLRPT
jgi:hypothetical protein